MGNHCGEQKKKSNQKARKKKFTSSCKKTSSICRYIYIYKFSPQSLSKHSVVISKTIAMIFGHFPSFFLEKKSCKTRISISKDSSPSLFKYSVGHFEDIRMKSRSFCFPCFRKNVAKHRFLSLKSIHHRF